MAAVILAVDHNPRNAELLSRFLSKQGYETARATTLEEFDRALDNSSAQLALVDIAGFDQTIWSRCDRLRKAGVPFVVISQQSIASIRETSADHGAHGTLFKPLATAELIALVRALLKP